MVNYELAKIYKIVCNITGLIYIGSTCKPILTRRLAKHRSDYKRFLNGYKLYLTSYEVLENNNYDIILIENVVCENKDALHSRERHYIESLECVNKVIPGRSDKEYYIDNKDKIKEYIKINKNMIAEKKKIYRDKNKVLINEKQNLKRKEKLLTQELI